jgi:hypothetical protein
LGVRFPDIVMQMVPPGAVLNLREAKGIPFVIINKSDRAVDVVVEPEIPVQGPAHAKDGYEPVPSAEWVKVIPNTFRMQPGEMASSDVILAVPDDKALVGRHFQINLRTRTTNAGFLAVAVVNFIRFSVGTSGPAELKKEKDLKTLQQLDLDLSPITIRLEGVPLGEKVDVKAFKGSSLKLTNRGDKPVKLRLESTKIPVNMQDFGWPSTEHPEWLTVSPALLKVKANRIEDAKVYLRIPKTPENQGKKFLFLVRAVLVDEDVALEVTSRIYVTTQ